jgi:hypothetical protein
MMLAHFGWHGGGFGGGILLFFIAMACIVIIMTWPTSKSSDKPESSKKD